MTLRILVALCWAARFAPAQAPVCTPVEGDRILGKDLARALPVFQAMPPETILGSTPTPGSRRTFHIPELLELAHRYSIAFNSPAEACFEWPMESLSRDRVLQAMRESLQAPDAHIDLAETSQYQVPRGRVEFPRETLGKPASQAQKDPVLWRGDVIYGGGHRFAVWARVRVKVACRRIFAVEPLKAGEPIDPRQVRTENAECFPGMETPGAGLLEGGLVPARHIAAGTEIRPELLTVPNDVNRGDTVEIEVLSGAARIGFTAKAESSGRSGDQIIVRNLSSNKVFQAVVEGKDKAVVRTDSIGSGH